MITRWNKFKTEMDGSQSEHALRLLHLSDKFDTGVRYLRETYFGSLWYGSNEFENKLRELEGPHGYTLFKTAEARSDKHDREGND